MSLENELRSLDPDNDYLALVMLEDENIDEILTLLFMHSGLGRLTKFDEIINKIIKEYDHLKEWRDEADEVS